MTADAPDIDAVVRSLLSDLAPEADLDKLDPGADFRQALDIDSFAFLQFVIGVHDKLGVEVPDADYAQVRTLDGCRTYFAARRPTQPPSSSS